MYKDDKERLKLIIERSVNQQGSSFLQEQIQANAMKKPDNLSPVVITDNKVQSQTNNAKSVTYTGRLNVHGDSIITREGYTYGL